MGLQHYYYPQAKLDASPRQGGLFWGGKETSVIMNWKKNMVGLSLNQLKDLLFHCFTNNPRGRNQLNSGKRACKNNRQSVGRFRYFASWYSSNFFLYSSSKTAFLGFAPIESKICPLPSLHHF